MKGFVPISLDGLYQEYRKILNNFCNVSPASLESLFPRAPKKTPK